jgi:tripartite-type tricarboxylate transporter receptor subunit TctC
MECLAMHSGRMALAALFAAILSWSATGTARAEDFYAGKTIKLYIGFGPGGGYDLYARVLARHLRRFIPGTPNVIPENMPGAGGLRVANYMANAAAKDGLSMAVFTEGGAIEQLLGNQAVRFDAAKFLWIGRMTSSTTLYFTWHTSPTKTFEDLRRRKTTFGATGAGNTDFLPKAMNKLAGAQFEVISGYKGANDILLAVERGEVEAGSGHYTTLRTTRKEWLSEGKMVPVVLVSTKRYPELPHVPIMSELGLTPEDNQVLALFSEGQLGRSFFTTPDVPRERVDILRKAFMAAMHDPEFLKEAAQQQLVIEVMSGQEIQQVVERVLATPKDLAQKAAEVRRQ